MSIIDLGGGLYHRVEKTKEQRRRESRTQRKCSCGNVAGINQTRCSRCRDREAREDQIAAEKSVIDTLVDALQMAKHIVAQNGTDEQIQQVFDALEKAGVSP